MAEAERAYERALGFLEKSDRTEREILDRLLRLGFSEAVCYAALDRLRDAGFVNDADYAARYIEALAAKGRGRLRIAADMRRKGLPEDIVRNAIEDGLTAENERERAFGAARSLWGSMSRETETRKAEAKVSRRLVSLGFSYETIGETMERIRSGGAEQEYEDIDW